MQERTPLWPLQGIGEGQSVLPWVSTLHPSQPRLGSEHPSSLPRPGLALLPYSDLRGCPP